MVKKHLDLVIVPCFTCTFENVDSERQEKMNRLLGFREKDKLFSEQIIKSLRDVTQKNVVEPIVTETITHLETNEVLNNEAVDKSTPGVDIEGESEGGVNTANEPTVLLKKHFIYGI